MPSPWQVGSRRLMSQVLEVQNLEGSPYKNDNFGLGENPNGAAPEKKTSIYSTQQSKVPSTCMKERNEHINQLLSP